MTKADPLPGAELLARLKQPFRAVDVEWKVGATNAKPKANVKPTKALMMAFVDARAVQGRLDAVFGTGWSDSYEDCKGGVRCTLSLLVDGVWLSRSDAGEEGSGELGSGPKASHSGALKRAASKFGVGRYLYDLPSVWVPCSEWSKVSPETLRSLAERYDAWTQRPEVVALYGEVWGHDLAETAVEQPEPVAAAETPPAASQEPMRPPSQPPAPEAPAAATAPQNALWPKILNALNSKEVDREIKVMALEMANCKSPDKDAVKAGLRALSKDKAEAILAVLQTEPAGAPS